MTKVISARLLAVSKVLATVVMGSLTAVAGGGSATNFGGSGAKLQLNGSLQRELI